MTRRTSAECSPSAWKRKDTGLTAVGTSRGRPRRGLPQILRCRLRRPSSGHRQRPRPDPGPLNSASPGVKIIVITAYASIDTAVEADQTRGDRLHSETLHPGPDQTRRPQGLRDAFPGAEGGLPAGGPGTLALRSGLFQRKPRRETRRRHWRVRRPPPTRHSCCGGKAARARASWPGPFTAGARGRTGPSASCPALPCRRNCWKASCSAMPRGRSPAPSATIPAGSAPARAAPCCWTRSATFPCPSSRSCCGSSRTRSTNASATT